MANRRMFSKVITESDNFLSMGTDVQNLYFHLGMQADDDGFVSPRRVMRMIGAADDSIKHLVSKGFVIPFESGVVVVTDWKENNFLRSDRYKPTTHQREMMQLVQNGGRYTIGIPMVDAGKDRLGKDRLLPASQTVSDFPIQVVSSTTETETEPKSPPKYKNARVAFSWFPKPNEVWSKRKHELESGLILFKKGEHEVKGALRFYFDHKDDRFCPIVNSPTKLVDKWEDLANYRERNDL